MKQLLDKIYYSQSVKKKKNEKSFWKSSNWLKGISDVQEIYDIFLEKKKKKILSPQTISSYY